MKSVLPDEPKQAAQDAASAAKEAAPEAPKDIPNPFSGFFSGQASMPQEPCSIPQGWCLVAPEESRHARPKASACILQLV